MYDQLTDVGKKSSLRKDAAFVYAGYFLRYLSLIVLIPYYGRVLGPASYGKVLAAMSLMNIVWLIVNNGLSITGAREMAGANTYAKRSRIFGRQTLARLMLVPLGAAIGIAGAFWSPVLAVNMWFGVLAVIQGILAAFNLGWFFQGVRRFRIGMAVEALSYPFTLIFVFLLVRDANDGLNVLIALILSAVICLTVAYSLSRKSSGFRMPRLKSGWLEIRHASVIFMASVSGMIMTYGSTYLLSLFSSSTEVGYFGAAERFAAFGLAMLGPAGQILMPTISGFHREDTRKAFRLARKGLALELGYGVLAAIGGVVLSPFMLPLIMGAKFFPSVPILQILVCMMPFSAFSHAVSLYVLIPLRKEKFLIMTTALGAAVNLIAAYFAIQSWGAEGMAVSRVCGEVTISCALLFVIVRFGLIGKIFAVESR